MAHKSLVPEYVEDYVARVITRETREQLALRAETAKLPYAQMQISADQGAFLQFLCRTVGARRTLEIGTFTGYSAMAVAMVLPEDGKVVACDVSEEWTQIAKRYWQAANVAQKIDLRLAPAADTLTKLLEGGEKERYDFAFIDADKTGYDRYYELCLSLVRKGGIIAFDNVLWSGKVASDTSDSDADTTALRALNLKIRDDARVDKSIVTVGDGLMLCLKR